ncbi:BrnA antitoxin family protein [Synechocystis sp. FACHB-383]|uniref:BrnA antitoxin family protein n=1 Tax=Synechocystis sp. FACHB-383 TaxID=2692864 RepID=UPI0016843032|nr:BrnA antitoxin family protein [Synechocystis sp. FACHB-383]MBD2655271.1 BrnA antitoxin family protein [Synechocystis sp. FACHB-383]
MKKNDSNATSRTNWSALESLSDEDIDYSDIPPLTDSFFERAKLVIPSNEAKNLVEIDSDLIQWFKLKGENYSHLINEALRQYIQVEESP